MIAHILALMLRERFIVELTIAAIGYLSLVVARPVPEYSRQQERLYVESGKWR